MKSRSIRKSLAGIAMTTGLFAASFALAQTAGYSVDHVVEFKSATSQSLAAYASLPEVAELRGSNQLFVANEDLDGDGTPELILQARSPEFCGRGDCRTLVLGKVNGAPIVLLGQNLTAALGVTTEKPGGYRALAAIELKPAIVIGDRPGTPLHRKPLVYPLVAGKGKAGGVASGPVCNGSLPCVESNELAAVVTLVRTSQWLNTRSRNVAITVSLRNKTSRPMVLGFEKFASVVTDDAGNRYSIQTVRGIPEVSQGGQVDTSYVLPPGGSSDARFEYMWQGSTLFGTEFEVTLPVREIEMLDKKRVRFGRQHGFNIAGLKSTTGAAAASIQKCDGGDGCFTAAPFTAEVVRITTSQPSNGPINAERIQRFEVRFRNTTDKPLILAHTPDTGVAIDDNDNRYGYWNPAININGIGQVRGNQIDTSLKLQPGESRNATMEMRFVYQPSRETPVDRLSLEFTVQEVGEYPGNQLAIEREHVVAFRGLTPGGGGSRNVVDDLKKLIKKKK